MGPLFLQPTVFNISTSIVATEMARTYARFLSRQRQGRRVKKFFLNLLNYMPVWALRFSPHSSLFVLHVDTVQ